MLLLNPDLFPPTTRDTSSQNYCSPLKPHLRGHNKENRWLMTHKLYTFYFLGVNILFLDRSYTLGN